MCGKFCIGAIAAVCAVTLSVSVLAQGAPIKLGVLEDQSGEFALLGMGKVNGVRMAVEEINQAGGVAGRSIELMIYDTQSDNTRNQEMMRRALQRDKVDVVFSGISSAAREAYRPIVRQFDGFAFYNNQYEGGVCDANMVMTGAVPEQQFSTLIPWMMQNYGKRVYTLAADYNFGQISAEWVRTIVAQEGGEVVGEDFIPLGVGQFAQNIQNIQRVKPDFVVMLLAGVTQGAYYEQALASNVGLPMASSVNIGQGYEHKRFKAPSIAGLYATPNYIEEVDTPQSRAFVEKWRQRFPDDVYVHQEGENSYLAVYLYKQMVERAGGSTHKKDLRAVIAQGDVCVDAPEGRVCIDPKSQHVSHTIYLARVNDDHSISFVQTWNDIQPYWLAQVGCDLTQQDDNAQYTPSDHPKIKR